MDERVERAHRLSVLVERLGLKSQAEICKRIPGRDGGLHRSWWNRWLSSEGTAVPTFKHLAGLVDNCIAEGRLQREDRARWLEAVDGILQPDRVNRATWERSLESAETPIPPPEPVVFVSPDPSRDGWSFSDCSARQFLNAAQSRCGLTVEQAHAALARLVGKAGNLQTRLYFTVGSRGSLTFYPGPRTFVVVTQGGRRQSFDVVGDGVSGWMEEEAGHGA